MSFGKIIFILSRVFFASFFILIIGFIAFVFFKVSIDDTVVAKTNGGVNYSLRGVDNTWPKIGEDQIDIASNLTKKNYYIVFDGSGSMDQPGCSNGNAKIDVAKSSVKAFISKISSDANLGLIIFDANGVNERVSLEQSSREEAISYIERAVAGNATPLGSSIKFAYDALTKQATRQLGYGEYHLVVITDGTASTGEEPGFIVDELLNSSPVLLHTIGFCISGGHALNQEGETIYKAADNPKQLSQGLDSVLAEAPNFQIDSFE